MNCIGNRFIGVAEAALGYGVVGGPCGVPAPGAGESSFGKRAVGDAADAVVGEESGAALIIGASLAGLMTALTLARTVSGTTTTALLDYENARLRSARNLVQSGQGFSRSSARRAA
ncbi:hypothetical protein A6A22_11420 [Arthrobacter sp. OY3WO11]|nr:hypothetical protein A6A22_11420 [Arthrobacter sp. OY3WO11]